jgi:hypothetical protein
MPMAHRTSRKSSAGAKQFRHGATALVENIAVVSETAGNGHCARCRLPLTGQNPDAVDTNPHQGHYISGVLA